MRGRTGKYTQLSDADADVDEDELLAPAPPRDLYTRASLLSRLTFAYADAILRCGSKRQLKPSDVPLLPPVAGGGGGARDMTVEEYADAFEVEWKDGGWEAVSPSRLPVLRVLVKLMWREYVDAFLWSVLYNVCNIAVPMCFNLVVSWSQDEHASTLSGFGYGILLFSFGIGAALGTNNSTFVNFTSGQKQRGLLCAVVLRKAMRLAQGADSEGSVQNYMMVDSKRYEDFAPLSNQLLCGPIWVLLIMGLLLDLLGWAAFGGVFAIVASTLISSYTSKLLAKTARLQQVITDERTQCVTELVQGIRMLKYYTWEDAMAARVQEIRKREMKLVRQQEFLRALNRLNISMTPGFVAAFSLMMYTFLGNTIKAETVFGALGLLVTMRFYMMVVPMSISSFAEVFVSERRLSRFFSLREMSAPASIDAKIAPRSAKLSGTFLWGAGGTAALKEMAFDAAPGALVGIVGSVGAGKTAFLLGLLGELYGSGKSLVKGSVAYTAQTPWIMNGTLRDNIVCGIEFDEAHYWKCIDACALRPDLEQLPDGEQTMLGERGITISGGQKQRVALARAAYRRADVYLFDDPLAAVDGHTAEVLMQELIGDAGILAGSTRILVTNKLSVLPDVGQVVLLKEGELVEQGRYQDLVEANGAFAELTRELEEAATTEESENVGAEDGAETGSAALAPSSPTAKKDEVTGGSSAGMPGSPAAAAQGATVTAASASAVVVKGGGKPRGMQEEERNEGSVPLAIWLRYAHLIGGIVFVAPIFIFTAASQGMQTLADVYVAYWAGHSDESTDDSTQLHYQMTYLGIILGASFATAGRVFLFAISCVRGATALHQQLLEALIRYPLRFFDTTPMGRTLNRFTADMAVPDKQISPNLDASVFMSIRLFLSLAVIVAIAPQILPFFMLCAWFYVTLAQMYRKTARELQRIVSTTRSPIFAHFSECLTGVITIRAFGDVPRQLQRNLDLVYENVKCSFYGHILIRWMAVRMELIAAVLLFSDIMLFIALKDHIPPALVGLILIQTHTANKVFSIILRNLTDCERGMTHVERIISYIDLPREPPVDIPEHRPPESWPSKGVVEFQNVQLRYDPSLPPALKGLSLRVNAAERLGLVGRTGAGKSTIAVALFRFVELDKGRITIDGIDIATMGLHALRGAVGVMPQEPTLFSGTLRSNLDPDKQHQDAAVHAALAKVRLTDAVREWGAGLDYEVAEGGGNLSQGQRQCICLARALLQEPRILIMDEATASIDEETDRLVQEAIRDSFSNTTILAIAHRLLTVADYDRIAVLADGRLDEIGTPRELFAKTPPGPLRTLAEGLGPAAFNTLKHVASRGRLAAAALEQDDTGS